MPDELMPGASAARTYMDSDMSGCQSHPQPDDPPPPLMQHYWEHCETPAYHLRQQWVLGGFSFDVSS